MLQTGQFITHFKIISPLGSGGMGEVYLAEDTRLSRKVALKLLPTHVTQDQKYLRRFAQEARTIAALSHPHVCAIHEVAETEDGGHCIVMEYVEGETLRKRLNSKRIAVREAVDIGIQVASALQAAHTAGIVHRDIKLENIMQRRDGYVKVLDFGLAKLTEQQDSHVDPEAATRALLNTSPGVVIGTVSYMSPEQARGLPVDARSDIWSLAVVLYEIVAGQRPFVGTTATDVIIALAERDPAPLSSHAPDVPAKLEHILKKALAKNREARYQSAADLLLALKSLKHDLEIAESSPSSPITKAARQILNALGLKSNRILMLSALLGILVIAGLVSVTWFRRNTTPVPITAIKSLAVLPVANLSGDLPPRIILPMG